MGKLNKKLRSIAEKVLPAQVFQKIAAIRSRRWQMRILRESGRLEQVRQYVREHGTVVRSGPFAGMMYPEDAALNRWSIPKLTGTYESEFHPFLEEFRRRRYDCVIDIGSAEGYYACGLARMLNVPVYAYDLEPDEKDASAMMARMNKVDHLVRLDNLFTDADMQKFSDNRALVVCDCEGFEAMLFTPRTLPYTRKWDLLIELHGEAGESVAALSWPHKISLLTAVDKFGFEDEMRYKDQRYLVCDSEG